VRRFDFHRARTLDDVLAFKADHGAEGRLLAGGTDLIISLRTESPALPPVHVMDITAIDALRGVSERGGRLRVGPLTTHTELHENPRVRKRALLLAQAAGEVGSPQIRNRGTIGGNLCNASACADTVPPLVALDATLTLRSARGTRTVPAAEAIVRPYRTVLEDDEVLTDIRFAPIERSAFVKLGRRKALSISRMSLAVVLSSDMSDVRIAGGSVTPVPRRFPEAEKVLTGQAPSEALYRRAGETVAAEMLQITGTRWSTPYKEPVVAALARRALRRAWEGDAS